MTRIVLSIVLAATVLAANDDKPGRRVRLGGISVGGSYLSGPAWYPYYGGYYPGAFYPGAFYPGWGRGYLYDPFFYSPYLHPGLYRGFGYGPNLGEVKLAASDKEAAVYLDGAYAGPAHKLKTLWLEPGAYNLELRDTSGHSFERRIYVLTGKTLQIQANLQSAKELRK